ncbi:MAG: FmdB family zinc ribbon protein [Gemmatimonadales bacterium]
MAIYEYYCPTCRNKFEQRRPMAQATAVATCEKGHQADRALSAFAAPRNGGAEPMMELGDGGGGGGCCGGGACACRSNN